MKDTKNNILTTFGLILTLTISAILVTLPITIAQDVPTFPTHAYIGAMPNPVGVNQQVLLHTGVFSEAAGFDYVWQDLTIEVTKPDGQTEILGPFNTDPTGGTGTIYIPSMVGTYTLQTHFPQQINRGSAGSRVPPQGTIMLASDSEILELVVQQEPIEYYPSHSLPTEYWTRPIDAQLREWSIISGSWLNEPATSAGYIMPYNDGPETPHILWAKPLTVGGLAGGATGVHGYDCGDAYEGKFLNPVIINGVLFYNKYGSRMPYQEIGAIDLHTGEEKWSRNDTAVSFGQNFYFDWFNYHAVFDYLWEQDGRTWNAYNTFNGAWEYSMTNVPSGVNIYGPNGEIYRYTVDLDEGWITLWNSSRVGTEAGGAGSWGRNVLGKTLNATTGIEWNVSIPTGLNGNINNIFLHDLIIGSTADRFNYDKEGGIQIWAINLKPGHESQLLYNTTWQPPEVNLTIGLPAVSPEDRIFCVTTKETRQWWGFDLDTGQELWGPTDPLYYTSGWQLPYGTGFPCSTWEYGISWILDGKLISGGFGGIVTAWDVTTGLISWTYDVNDPYTEILFGNTWPIRFMFAIDGKLYMSHDEHSPVDPKPRGAPFICLDIETGQEIWRINGAFRQTQWGGRAIIGDSIIATQDTYDQRIYAIGKGPSEITVDSAESMSLGTKSAITGTVMDTSPGTEDPNLKLRFPKGVPAISDAYMSDWMLYVYKNFERPAAATGVSVKIEAVDPNNNYQNYGTVTSNSYGNFVFNFEPEVPGVYMIIATFEGSGAYYGSTDMTYISVNPAPTPTTPIEPEVPTEPEEPEQPTEPTEPEQPTEPTEPEQPTEPEEPEVPTEPEQPAEAPLISTEVAILVAVAVTVVIGIVAFWTLRKRQ